MEEKINQGIQELNFSSVIGDRFGRYSKYIIQDRALPDIRDGLKPVQRRILYAMYDDGNTAEKAYRKSAKTVGNVIGNFHPHGDSSVYEAMVRMSQNWKNRQPLIDMHGNNGSMDGDPAAAMRYTEARLSTIAMEQLADIHADTVDWMLNFDDTVEEPRVLPSRFPNLLVNGTTGISAGYATEIPPHNLGEVIDALIFYLNQKQTASVEELMKYLPGPDFPTGGIIQGKEGILDAYRTGQGKIVIRSKVDIQALKGGKSQLLVSEIPFDVNKAKLIQKLDEIRISKRIDGIVDVRDDSDRNGVALVIELKKEADPEAILAYLYKTTELQVNYHFNMVAIHNRRPELCSLPLLLGAYLNHQQEVIRRRTAFYLKRDRDRLHIVDGLIRVLSILDEVIATIRQSENKADAKNNLVKEYDFTLEQAEAIVNLQLYRLTNTDIVTLQDEKLSLNERIMMYQNILANPTVLNKVLINELKEIKKKYQSPRRTELEEKIETIQLEKSLVIAQEQVYVTVTKEGYFKRTSVRSFSSSDVEDLGSRDLDFPLFVRELSTHDAIIILTSMGNYIHLPVHELPDIRWKEMGVHWSQLYHLQEGETIVAVFAQDQSELTNDKKMSNDSIVLVTRSGRIKQTLLSEFTTYRSYKSRTMQAIKLQDSSDRLVAARIAKTDHNYQVGIFTRSLMGLRFNLDQVASQGLKAQGVMGIKLKEQDQVEAMVLIDTSLEKAEIVLLSCQGVIKRMDFKEVSMANRATMGSSVLKVLKSKPQQLLEVLALPEEDIPLLIQGDTGKQLEMRSHQVSRTNRMGKGQSLPDSLSLGKLLAIHPARLKMLDD